MSSTNEKRFPGTLGQLPRVKVSRAEPPVEAVTRSSDVTYRVRSADALNNAFERRTREGG